MHAYIDMCKRSLNFMRMYLNISGKPIRTRNQENQNMKRYQNIEYIANGTCHFNANIPCYPVAQCSAKDSNTVVSRVSMLLMISIYDISNIAEYYVIHKCVEHNRFIFQRRYSAISPRLLVKKKSHNVMERIKRRRMESNKKRS